MPRGRGRLIVIEGLDRSGKSTQCARLLARLLSTTDDPAPSFSIERSELRLTTPGMPPSPAKTNVPRAIGQKFPDRSTVIGSMIDAYLTRTTELDDHAIHLLFSANRWECAPTLIEHLNDGTHVICDRYVYSGIAFSAVKGLDAEWCRSSDVGLPKPDLVLFLDVSETVAALRGGYGEERYERADMQRLVRSAFMHLFRGDDAVRVVDASQDVDAVEQEIWRHVESLLSGNVDNVIGRIE